MLILPSGTESSGPSVTRLPTSLPRGAGSLPGNGKAGILPPRPFSTGHRTPPPLHGHGGSAHPQDSVSVSMWCVSMAEGSSRYVPRETPAYPQVPCRRVCPGRVIGSPHGQALERWFHVTRLGIGPCPRGSSSLSIPLPLAPAPAPSTVCLFLKLWAQERGDTALHQCIVCGPPAPSLPGSHHVHCLLLPGLLCPSSLLGPGVRSLSRRRHSLPLTTDLGV